MTEPQLWQSLLDALTEAGEGVAVVDIETERFLFANEALADMYGYTVHELLALPTFFDLLVPEEAAALGPAAADRVAGGPGLDGAFDTRVARKDGRIIDIEASVRPVSSLPGKRLIAIIR